MKTVDGQDGFQRVSRPSLRHFTAAQGDRAIQFAPFAALTGHSAALDETARLTAPRIELSTDEQEQLNRSLCFFAERLPHAPPAEIIYFQPDGQKEGGAYIQKVGGIRRIDSAEKVIIMRDRTVIPICDIISILPTQETAAPL